MTTPASDQRTSTAGAYLREHRKHLEIGLRELAGRIGLAPSYISMIETGDRQPSEEIIRKMAHEVGADADEALRLAGLIPSDIHAILIAHPEMWEKLRSVY